MTGAELKAWREARNLSQEQVGLLAGKSRATILRYEKAEAETIPGDVADKLREAATGEAPGKVQHADATPAEQTRSRFAGAFRSAVAPLLRSNEEFGAGMGKVWDQRPAPPFIEADGSDKGRVWQRVGCCTVHPDVPDPQNVQPPAWARGSGVVGGDGEVYDRATGMLMRAPGGHRAATYDRDRPSYQAIPKSSKASRNR